MNELIKAISDKYGTVNDFRTNLTGGLHSGEAPQGTAYPLAVLNVVSITPNPLLDTDIDEAIAQFTIFSSNRSPSEAGTLYGYLKSLFDDSALVIVGYTHISMEREIHREIQFTDAKTGEKFWQYITDYRVIFEKD